MEIEKNRKYTTAHPSGGFLEQTIFAAKSKIIWQEKDTSHLNSDWKKMSEEITEFATDVKKSQQNQNVKMKAASSALSEV